VKKRSKISENDIHMYLRLFPKYGAKLSSQKKVMGSKVDEIGFLLGIPVHVHFARMNRQEGIGIKARGGLQ
jgi:hypothetical protein